MFYHLDLVNFIPNSFEELSKATKFEDVAKGRQGAIIYQKTINNCFPIVRTTTIYRNSCQRFASIHDQLIDEIKKSIETKQEVNQQRAEQFNMNFNNAMVEIYDSQYRKMGYHTDQSLDLETDSVICLFSCYENPLTLPQDLRKLKIKNKITQECSQIVLKHNSIVFFSTKTNQQHVHKIELDSFSNNKWLGVTFRVSKTLIKFDNGVPLFDHNNQVLRVANDQERKEFIMYKGMENANYEYVYPEINYSLSKERFSLSLS